jgi:hypothetical protein
MRVISSTDRGALALFYASYESSFKVPYDCYTMAAHRVLGFIAERASHVRKCPRCNEATSSESRGSGSSSTVSGTSLSGERSTSAMFMDHIPRCPCSWYVIQLHHRIVRVLVEFKLEAGATNGVGPAVGGPPYSVGSFSRSPWGYGLVRLHGSAPSSCC